MQNCDVIAAEDTRVTGILLKHLSISKPLISLQKFNEVSRISQIQTRLERGENVVLLSDAGTPCISDPGTVLIKALHEAKIRCIPIPGPSAVTAFLSVSGLSGTSFFFGGFFSKKPGKEDLEFFMKTEGVFVYFETALRLEKTIQFLEQFEDRIAYFSVGKELSKTYETLIAGSLKEVREALQQVTIKGEWIIGFELKTAVYDERIEEEVAFLKNLDLSKRQILAILERRGISKNKAYNTVQKELLN